MKLIVGLGNPGEKYSKTRHNIGFMVVEQFLKDFEPVEKTVWNNETKFKSDIVELTWQRRLSGGSSGQAKRGEEEKVILAKPKTYMNNSGLAVQLLALYYKVAIEDIWIIHDEVDLPLGGMKIRLGGASAGHRGVESIIETLGADKFWRFRMGIGRPIDGHYEKNHTKGVDDYVLGVFSGAEHGKIKELIKHGSKAIATALEESLAAAQNRFNIK